MSYSEKIIGSLYGSKILGSIFPTLDHCLRKELEGCESVLDLGCGESSPLQNCQSVKRSVGVDAHKEAIEKSKSKNIHTQYLEKRLEEIDFPEKSFDAVILIEVLEHLDKNAGHAIIEKAKKWARGKIVVTTPNGFFEQKEMDSNPFQAHLSGWNLKDLENLGFQCRGLAGWKHLRKNMENPGQKEIALATIRCRPKFFWFGLAALSQTITYHFPGQAFGLFCVNRIAKENIIEKK
jgi:SAM-dependent methyltransferase